MKKTILISFIVALSLGVPSVIANTPAYTITDLGPLTSYGYGINDSGKVVGSTSYNAFLYDGMTVQELYTLPSRSKGFGISNNGYVVGEVLVEDSDHHAFLYDGTMMHDLGTLGGKRSTAYGINDSSHIVGQSYYDRSPYYHAFLYDGTMMHDLGTLGGTYSSAKSINNNGRVAGWSYDGNDRKHAFLYDGTTMHDLGTLGGPSSQAWGINNIGQVVGTSYTEDIERHAFLYDRDTMYDLGILSGASDSWALAINDSGQIVGYNTFVNNAEMFTYDRAFIYDEINEMVNLDTLIPSDSGWDLWEATDINNSGQITGYGFINGDLNAFLMTPIPEPATLLLFGLGALVLRRCK